MRPLLGLQNKWFPIAFCMILDYHLQDGATILDPTPGERHSWKKYDENIKYNNIKFFKDKEYNITNTTCPINTLKLKTEFDGIFFDPPYMFWGKATKDKRETEYGTYNHTFENIQNIINDANDIFPKLLKPTGKLFFKYTDVYTMENCKFYHCVSIWPGILSNFKVIDHYIIQHHHIPFWRFSNKHSFCRIGNYTYLTIFQK